MRQQRLDALVGDHPLDTNRPSGWPKAWRDGPRAGSDCVAVRTHLRPEWFVVNLALAKLRWQHVAGSRRLTPAEARAIVEECGPRALILDDEEPGQVAVAMAGPPVSVVSVGTGSGGTVAFDTVLDSPRREGSLERGLRHVIGCHVIFHRNRLGLSARTQSILAGTARSVILEM